MKTKKRDSDRQDIEFFFILGWNMAYRLAEMTVQKSRSIRDAEQRLRVNRGEMTVLGRALPDPQKLKI